MDWASLETQQPAELAVKGTLRAGITYVTAHSVVKLPGHFGEAVPEAIQRCSRGLDRAYIRSGYPDAYASGPPWITPITMPPPKQSTAPARSWAGSIPKLPRAPWSRDERLERARAHVERLGLGRYRALLFGSVARGDFISESDTDVLIVGDGLPQDFKPRLDLIFDARDIAPEVEPIGWTSAEWADREARGDGFMDILRREAVLLAANDEQRPPDGPTGQEYPNAVDIAVKETRLPPETFPAHCPDSDEALLRDDLYPACPP